MDGAGGPPVLTIQEAQAEIGALSPRQQVAVGMLIQSREAFAAEQRAARPVANSRVAVAPDEPQGSPVVEDAYIEAAAPVVGADGGEDDRRPPPASMEEYRARLAERMQGARSHPGGIDTRYIDQAPPQLTHQDVFAIAEQVANAVLSRYDATRVPPFATAVSPVAAQAPVFGAYLPPAPAPGQPARPFTPWAYWR